MARPNKYVIVGASLAGLSAAEALRSSGYDGELMMIGKEPVRPYDRPPLSKQILISPGVVQQPFLRADSDYDRLGIDWKLGRAAVGLDLRARKVLLDGDETVSFDGLVIATGASPRRLSAMNDLEGLHVLRTFADAMAIRRELDAGPRVCVVGAGFIGGEVAAVCRAKGLQVTIVEALRAPLAHVLPSELAMACVKLHLDHGVDLRCSSTVIGFEGDRRVSGVLLADGSRIPADLVVVGIGVQPETDWLASSGLELDNGLVCDATLATRAADIVGAGDVVRWPNALFGETMRIEHWTNAIEQGAAAARRLRGGPAYMQPFTSVPYVWSDQYDTKIQIIGRVKPGDDVFVSHGSLTEGKFIALTGRAGKLVGAVTFNEPRKIMGMRRAVADRTPWSTAITNASHDKPIARETREIPM